MTLTTVSEHGEFEFGGGRPRPRRCLVASHAWYGDVIGGSFRLASEFAEDLAARGHDVSFVCCAPRQGEHPAAEVSHGVRVYRYPPPPPRTTHLSRLLWHLAHTKRIAKRLDRESPFHVLSGHSPLQFLGAARAMGHRSTFKSYVVHSPFDDEILANRGQQAVSLGTHMAAIMARQIDAACIRRADRVQTDSRYTLIALQAKHGRGLRGKGVASSGWVDCSRFHPAADKRSLRRSLGGVWDTDVPVFLTVRRLEARMGIDTLIAAAARVAQARLPFRVLIGGAGSLRPDLERQAAACGAENVVSFLGRLPEDRLPDCYAAADCFILPTRALECFGLIVLESFAAGTPVIASDVAAIPELAAVQGPEWMFPPGDADALADRMRLHLQAALRVNSDLRAVAAKYDRDAVTRTWEQLTSPSRHPQCA